MVLGESKGEVAIFGEDCCSTTFEAALMASVRERQQLSLVAAAYKTTKGFFLQFVFKTKPKTQQSTISIPSGSSFTFQPFLVISHKMNIKPQFFKKDFKQHGKACVFHLTLENRQKMGH